MILTLLILNKYNGDIGKKRKIVYAIFLFSIFLPVITIYLQNSNYWVGDNVLSKHASQEPVPLEGHIITVPSFVLKIFFIS